MQITTAQQPPKIEIPRKQRRVHPLMRDLALTSATQVSSFLATLIVTSLFGRLFGVIALGEYLLLRRVWAWMITVVQLGMHIALPRYVSQAIGRSEAKERSGKYFLAAGTCLAATTVGLTFILNAKPSTFSGLLFGDAHRSYLILPLSVFLLGYAIHAAVFGFYRGMMRMGAANALLFCNFTVVPIVSVSAFWHTGSTARVVACTGAMVGLVSLVFSIPIFKDYAHRDSLRFAPELVELTRYGASRIAGDFGAGAIFALGPIVASHYMPLAQVSSLLLGTSVLMAISMTATPLGIVLLSKVSMMLAQKRQEDVQLQVRHLLTAVLELSVFASLQVVIFADVLIRYWVGPKFLDDMLVIRLVSCAIPFYLFYVTFRTIIDAASPLAHNTRNLVAALSAFVLMQGAAVFIFRGYQLLEGIAIALLLSIAVLACLTAYRIHRLYDVSIEWRASLVPLAVAALLSAGSLVLRRLSGYRFNLASLSTYELAIWVLYVGLLFRQGSSWIPFVWNMAFRQQMTGKPVTRDD